jgi:cytochrome P450
MPRLMDESWVVLAAGTTTTARALSMASFHIFSEERILRTLRQELRPVMPRLDSQPTFAELEGLPYLVSCSSPGIQNARSFAVIHVGFPANACLLQNAIIDESLRLSHGVLFRAPRIAPDDALQYNTFVIPPGVSCIHPSIYRKHAGRQFIRLSN